jgi:hypothetical protein
MTTIRDVWRAATELRDRNPGSYVSVHMQLSALPQSNALSLWLYCSLFDPISTSVPSCEHALAWLRQQPVVSHDPIDAVLDMPEEVTQS